MFRQLSRALHQTLQLFAASCAPPLYHLHGNILVADGIKPPDPPIMSQSDPSRGPKGGVKLNSAFRVKGVGLSSRHQKENAAASGVPVTALCQWVMTRLIIQEVSAFVK